MSDPLNPTVADGGLNSSDTQDWNASSIRIPWYLSAGAIVLVAGVLFLIGVIAVKVGGVLKPQPAAAVAAGAPTNTAGGLQAGAQPGTQAGDPANKDAEIAALRRQIALLQAQTQPGSLAAPAPAYATDPSALSVLAARLDRVEANQRVIAHAAMVAGGASALEATARTGAPFALQLAALEPGLNDPALVAPLKPYADKGVPTEVDLAVRFRAAAADANIAGKSDTGDKSLLGRSLRGLGTLLHLSVRRTDNPDGVGTQAVLQQAEIRMNRGDLAAAVGYLDTLKPAAHKAMEPWLADAKARLLVDATTQRIVDNALSRMAQVNAGADAATTPGATL